MRVRVKGKHRVFGTNFRRVGITFTQEWTDVDPSTLTPQQIDLLKSEESSRYLEVEDAPDVPPPNVPAGTPGEAIAGAMAAGESLPGGPSQADIDAAAHAATKKSRSK